MILEINLVKIPQRYSTIGSLLERTRIQVDTDSAALDQISKFIKSNIDTIEAAVSDKAFVKRLETVNNLSIGDLFDLKYYLASLGGIDLWIWAVSEEEVNPTTIGEGIDEYNIVDRIDMASMFIPNGTKIAIDKNNMSYSDFYTKIDSIYNIFGSDIAEGMPNPIMALVNDAIKPLEESYGRVNDNVRQYLDSILQYFGKDVYIINS